MSRRPQILVLDADPALLGLLGEWLADIGDVTARPAAQASPCDLLVVDVPYPRQGESNPLRRLAETHPGTPVLALSPTFFAGIEPYGAVARELGVAGVLPKPVPRDALVAAVRRLLPHAA